MSPRLKSLLFWLFIAVCFIAFYQSTYGQDQPPYRTDPRISRTIATQAQRFPAPEGCRVVGGWEDGSIVAYCVTGEWLAHGPDPDDSWTLYTGPIMPLWANRAAGVSFLR